MLIAYFGLARNKHKDSQEEGSLKGAIASDIGYIKAGVDDLKREIRETRQEVQQLSERVTRCEESTKQAHKRLDSLQKGV